MSQVLHDLATEMLSWVGPAPPQVVHGWAAELMALAARPVTSSAQILTVNYKTTVNDSPVRIDYSQMHGEVRVSDAGPTPLRGRVTRRDE